MKIRIDALDALFSEFVRKRAIKRAGGCERCLTPLKDIVKENGDIFPAWKQLQCCHFHGRARKSVRYDEDNAFGGCWGCHQYLDSHPYEKCEFFKKLLGDNYDLLNSRMRDMRKVDKQALTLYYRERLK